LGSPRHRWADPRPGRRKGRATGRTRSRLTIAVDFEGHGIGKLLVPLVVRRQARAEMPGNIAKLKKRVEASPRP